MTVDTYDMMKHLANGYRSGKIDIDEHGKVKKRPPDDNFPESLYMHPVNANLPNYSHEMNTDDPQITCLNCGTVYRASEQSPHGNGCPMNCRKTKYRRVYGD